MFIYIDDLMMLNIIMNNDDLITVEIRIIIVKAMQTTGILHDRIY